MKRIKKLASLMLAAIMVLAMGITASAGTITINPNKNLENGEEFTTEYTYYQLLRASIKKEADANGEEKITAVSYYLNNDQKDNALKALLEQVEIDPGVKLFDFKISIDQTSWVVSLNKHANGTDVTGEEIAALLNTDDIKKAALATDTKKPTNGANGIVELDYTEAGYYLITSSLGSKLVIDTVGGDVDITEKNEYITNVKTANKTNMAVGDKVMYTIEIKIPESATVGEVVTVHDTLDEHLDIRGDVTAKIQGGDAVVLDDVVDGDDEYVAGETFIKSFTITKAMLGNSVVLSYEAELLSTAESDDGYVNDVYSNTPSYKTKPSDVEVWTFDFELDKNFQDVTDNEAANYSATFVLKDKDDNVISFTKEGNKYVKADSTANSTEVVKELVVNGLDNIQVVGLAEGTYTLIETDTATGYNLMTEAVAITITDTTPVGSLAHSHTVSYKIGTDDAVTGTNNVVTILNSKGSLLPSTGGIGTTIFYVVGGILVIGAGLILITRKRMSKEQ